jgi:hypothetical protein
MAYYTRTGDPLGTWEGRGCAALGVCGTAEADVAERLYQQGVGPGGERIIQYAWPAPQGHPKIVSNRFAETIFRTHS